MVVVFLESFYKFCSLGSEREIVQKGWVGDQDKNWLSKFAACSVLMIKGQKEAEKGSWYGRHTDYKNMKEFLKA